MKYISIILCTLITTTAFAQHKCKPGYRDIMTMETSGYRMVGGCYPDSIAKKMLNVFYKNMCEEGQMSIWSRDLRYSDKHTWNDSTGCTSKKTCEAWRDGKWVEITEKEYDSLSVKK